MIRLPLPVAQKIRAQLRNKESPNDIELDLLSKDCWEVDFLGLRKFRR